MTSSQCRIAILTTLLVLMTATRSHHFSSYIHLPDASWAMFFLGGFHLRTWRTFAMMSAAALATDAVAIEIYGVSSFCISPAYIFLLPTFASLWLAGRWSAARFRFDWTSLPCLLGAVLASVTVAELLSSGSFYFGSGRFAETTLTGFIDRLIAYFPQSLSGFAAYLGLGFLTQVIVRNFVTAAPLTAAPPHP